MTTIPILHFNDVYRVQPFKLHPTSPETIDVTQFAANLDEIRDTWPLREDGTREGLVLFSGDVFAPSVESSVTRGSHMVPIMNAIKPDVSMTGNHDFDFGFPHLSKLIKDTNFPWLLSNIVDTTTHTVPENLLEFLVLEKNGVRIGFIGLVEKEWIGTVSSWPSTFKYKDVTETGLDLSKRLRDPTGEYRCDIIIALTHARLFDIQFAKSLAAHSPGVQDSKGTASRHGVDIILGGHDHLYYISKGVTSWEGYDVNEKVLGAEHDEGDVLIVKSGTDFRDLSEFTIELEDTPEGSVRRKLIKSIRGKRHETQPDWKKSERIAKLLEKLLDSVSSTLKAPVCKTSVELDCRSALVRTQETASGNWFADVLRHAYDDMLILKGCGGSDGVFICGGTIRGDSVYGPGNITLGDILEILPFEDPIVVLELDGTTIWDALEASLSTWPAQEGRFPIVSGFRVVWDSRRPPGQRVVGVWLIAEPSGSTTSTPIHMNSKPDGAPLLTDIEEIKREKGGKKYKIVTREYMAEGHDGFTPFKGQPHLIDDESGQMMSTIVRKYLLGCRFVNRMARLSSESSDLIHEETATVIRREKARQDRYDQSAKSKTADKWRHVAQLALRWSRAHYKDNLYVTEREHMSDVDCFDGDKMRSNLGEEVVEKEKNEEETLEEDLITIHPIVDGRLFDKGRSDN
ncbi:Metallo-dependent phosphatase [Panus rudis PR-1116 ss-1]|nr:Metallo-dependent phosphatase [Panus rudis PR-1116 ss-1]